MEDGGGYGVPKTRRDRQQAGIISRIRLENFMCHSSFEMEFGDWVNFVTGQNGSGKSAILTALCVAFGSRARGTQRANTMKDFIKTGCSYALIEVEVKNEGVDAFKPELYGSFIIVGRRITESASSITLKNSQGRKIGTKKEDLREIVEHFNIDVENPCVVMTQDKSREFLHSGSPKDKFKLFFKATLLQQVNDLLSDIERQMTDAATLVNHLEDSLRPILKEIDELQEKIRNVELVEELSQQVQLLRKRLAWAWVYDAEKKLNDQLHKVEKLKGRVPDCQGRIDQYHSKMEELGHLLEEKKHQISEMIDKTSEVRRKKEELNHSLSMAVRERVEVQSEKDRVDGKIQKIAQQIDLIENQIRSIHEEYVGSTQAEEDEIRGRLEKLRADIEEAQGSCQRMKQEENEIGPRIASLEHEIENISNEIREFERIHRGITSRVNELHANQRNKVTAFGGGRVMSLLQSIERNQYKFRSPPLGPIGAHVKLENADLWSVAIEHAVGRLLSAFIVTDSRDARTLRACAKEANYNSLQIVIYDFSKPRIDIPRHMLPQTDHPTALSVLHSDNATVLNVLVDMASAERQVLVENYDVGRMITFDQRIPNLKESIASDGTKMFYRGSAQTTLPPNRNLRGGRLSGSFDKEILDLERQAMNAKHSVEQAKSKKRGSEGELRDLQDALNSVKNKRIKLERNIRSQVFELEDIKKSLLADAGGTSVSNESELREDICKLQNDLQEKKSRLKMLQKRVDDAESKAGDLKISFKKLCESASSEINALAEAERELMRIEEDLQKAKAEKKHYEEFMQTKILPVIKNAEVECEELEKCTKENRQKASIICPESEVQALAGSQDSNPEQLSAELSRLKRRFDRETERFPESIDELKTLLENKERRIFRKQQVYKDFREKLEACNNALQLRWGKFQRNATLLKRQLTWQFNGHLKKKGISGQIKVSYEEQTLSIEVRMPHDASSSSVNDTRGLSGGERSFSTLCFTLALHDMIEAPFRAMDEFDVFMDSISRKISMDALVDFALAQGSQWIFITPHDISMVKDDVRIKKQQMRPPRG